jgi:hypothetical protein
MASKFVYTLKRKNENKNKVIDKIKTQTRLSSQEFLDVYNSIWKEGPPVHYQNPDSRVRYYKAVNEEQNP